MKVEMTEVKEFNVIIIFATPENGADRKLRTRILESPMENPLTISVIFQEQIGDETYYEGQDFLQFDLFDPRLDPPVNVRPF